MPEGIWRQVGACEAQSVSPPDVRLQVLRLPVPCLRPVRPQGKNPSGRDVLLPLRPRVLHLNNAPLRPRARRHQSEMLPLQEGDQHWPADQPRQVLPQREQSCTDPRTPVFDNQV